MSTIDEILKSIADNIVENYHKNNNGLLSGLTGEAVFMLEYSKINAEYEKYVEVFIDEINDSIEKGMVYHSHCAGMSGLVLGLDYIYRGYYDEDYDKPFDFLSSEIENFISLSLQDCLNKKNIDFLHGAIGIGFYYIKRLETGDTTAKKYLIDILNYLEKSAVVEGDIVKWYMALDEEFFNISLAHGISSIIIFLSKLLSLNIDFENNIKFLLEGAVNYILSQEIDKDEYGSCFPFVSIEKEKASSRLAWCYGDLGVAIALMDASKALNNDVLYKKALEVFDFSLGRKDLDENMIYDAPICHGSAGVALIFFIIYQETKDVKYLEAAKYWEAKTLEIIENQNSIINCFYDSKRSEFIGNLSVLEGLAGIGLTLIKINYNSADWHKFLLV